MLLHRSCLLQAVSLIMPCVPLSPQVLQIQEGDVCLTLTSGGCNALNLCIQGAAQVVSVDCNPAQSALLELKAVAIQCALRSHIAYGHSHACSYSVLAMRKLNSSGELCPGLTCAVPPIRARDSNLMLDD